MDEVFFLSLEEIIAIHEKMIEIGGGLSNIRDIELLHSAVERPKVMFGGKYLYQSILGMGSALLQSLAKNHPFVDGNKRTAFFSTLRFFEKNGLVFTIHSPDIVQFMVQVDTENLTISEISGWFEERLTT